jgi:SAM-dependent MidA family methyltransferase
VLDLTERLARLIETNGPISVAHYMAEANALYYATRDPLGAAGDFTTAPEISQMFGELIGLCLADLWARGGAPADVAYVELGPGRGTLAADALRGMRSAGLRPAVHLVETSPVLREAQAQRIREARWHDDAGDLPTDVPLLIVANEFFDALPVRQLVATDTGWRERVVVTGEGRFRAVAGPRITDAVIPVRLRDSPPGTFLETSAASTAIARQLADLIARFGGAALIIDYGHAETSVGDTLQAVSRHNYADPWVSPGERDLTAHVDFEALGAAASAQGVRVLGPVPQGQWLRRLGIEQRAAALARGAPERAEELAGARDRLIAADQMGTLFKVMALVAPDWPDPAGFA